MESVCHSYETYTEVLVIVELQSCTESTTTRRGFVSVYVSMFIFPVGGEVVESIIV